jgi:hypothetical protein
MNVLDKFSKNTHISSLMTIHPVETTFFHADGQTDVTKLMVAFRNFANMPKNLLKYKDMDAGIL